jgi:peptidoglycan/xylan/chitin deacetylase (PgdA/CDA1 family)
MPHLSFLFRFPSKLRRRARRSRMLTLLLLLFLIFVLIFPFYSIYKPPKLLIRYFQIRWPDVLWEVDVPKGQKVIALTIDDAPSENTEEILKVLKENGARATFFVIGAQIDGREGVLNRMVADGMELGNHAMRDEPARALPIDVLEKQINDVQTRIDDAYSLVGRPHPKQHFFRPGSGFFTDAMRDMVRKLGYKLALGSVYPHDPQIPYAWVNARHVLSMVRPGAIVICHDRRGWTAPMLRKVLPKLKRKGWEVVTLSELVERGKKE